METADSITHPEYLLRPCLACRRRIRVAGRPLFTTCSCLNYGCNVTIVALAAGAMVAASLGLLLAGKRK